MKQAMRASLAAVAVVAWCTFVGWLDLGETAAFLLGMPAGSVAVLWFAFGKNGAMQ